MIVFNDVKKGAVDGIATDHFVESCCIAQGFSQAHDIIMAETCAKFIIGVDAEEAEFVDPLNGWVCQHGLDHVFKRVEKLGPITVTVMKLNKGSKHEQVAANGLPKGVLFGEQLVFQADGVQEIVITTFFVTDAQIVHQLKEHQIVLVVVDGILIFRNLFSVEKMFDLGGDKDECRKMIGGIEGQFSDAECVRNDHLVNEFEGAHPQIGVVEICGEEADVVVKIICFFGSNNERCLFIGAKLFFVAHDEQHTALGANVGAGAGVGIAVVGVIKRDQRGAVCRGAHNIQKFLVRHVLVSCLVVEEAVDEKIITSPDLKVNVYFNKKGSCKAPFFIDNLLSLKINKHRLRIFQKRTARSYPLLGIC